MHVTEYEEHLSHIRACAASLGLTLHVGSNLSDFLADYARLTGTGYAQRPFMVSADDTDGPNLWAALVANGQTVCLTAFRTVTVRRRGPFGSFLADGGLYAVQSGRQEAWRRDAGPHLPAGAKLGYVGGGWIHPSWRGKALSGLIVRAVQDLGMVRSGRALHGTFGLMSQTLQQTGLAALGTGMHYLHDEVVLDGYLDIVEGDMRLHLVHSTAEELGALYALELASFRNRQVPSWLKAGSRVTAAESLRASAPRSATARK